MAKLYFIALAITCLLPALCDGKPIVLVSPLCPNGNLDKDTIDNSVLKVVNKYREDLINGTQKNGALNQMLPPPKGMTQLEWGCELEQKAMTTLNGMCPTDEPADPDGLATLFSVGYDDFPPPTPDTPPAQLLSTSINTLLGNIEFNPLNVVSQGTVSKTVTFTGPDSLKDYAEFMRPQTTQIGCAINKCGAPDYPFTIYCIGNTKTIQVGETVYEGLTDPIKSCADVTCPTGTVCNETTYICVNTTSAATTTPMLTTMSTATSTSPTSSSPTTSSPTAAPTTTMPTSPQAEFPGGGAGGGMCSSVYNYADRMTDTLRNEYVRLHNFRRGLLATGQIPRKDGKYLPKAANMWKMSYDCTLEEGAVKHASTCPSALSEPSSRQGIGENLKTFPATRFDFNTAAKKSVTEWWKPIRDVNYFENVVVFRPFHDGAPISSFTQVGDLLVKTSIYKQ
ncbi:hypothetical protein Y032_0004g1763 [Ancylostoma ceylanicum]|uniref:SCP domain-containing protein n=1 Tax=Ancylostoma ceylanicum TaxID=53326 RepID=A0A016VVI0_9BILA|nr:hypothetical protein Y032_0004g1763 [Ancylostoma ceylanicum]